eukprot:CFRG1694T1
MLCKAPLTVPLDVLTVIAKYCDPKTLAQLRLCSKEVAFACAAPTISQHVVRNHRVSCCYWRDKAVLDYVIKIIGEEEVYFDICERRANPDVSSLHRITNGLSMPEDLLVYAAQSFAADVFVKLLSLNPGILRDASDEDKEDIILECVCFQEAGSIDATRACFETLGIDTIAGEGIAYEAYLTACVQPHQDLVGYFKTFIGFNMLEHTEEYEQVCECAKQYIYHETTIDVLRRFCSRAVKTAFNESMVIRVQKDVAEEVIDMAFKTGNEHVEVIRQAAIQNGVTHWPEYLSALTSFS